MSQLSELASHNYLVRAHLKDDHLLISFKTSQAKQRVSDSFENIINLGAKKTSVADHFYSNRTVVFDLSELTISPEKLVTLVKAVLRDRGYDPGH